MINLILSALPLVSPRGVKGAALAACDDIVDGLARTGNDAGVKDGESTFNVFFALEGNVNAVLENRLVRWRSLWPVGSSGGAEESLRDITTDGESVRALGCADSCFGRRIKALEKSR